MNDWYRVTEVKTYAGVHILVHTLRVLKTTPKGVWFDDFGRRRFVLTGARKRFACPNLKEAVESFKARKQRQITILTSQLGHANDALERIEQWEKTGSFSFGGLQELLQ